MYEEIRDDIVTIARRAYSMGYAPACSGNISVRTPDGNGFVIKASGASFADMEPDDMLFVDWQGMASECGGATLPDRHPSIETPLHAGLYRVCDNARSVVHLHSPYTTAASFVTGEIPIVTEEAKETLKRVPVVANLAAGSKELAQAVGRTFSHGGIIAAVISEHGPVAIGDSVREAFHNLETLEHNCRVAVIIRGIKATR